jgi:glutathione S-transferase
MHPLSSFCWKALIALYETAVPFEPHVVNLGDPTARAAFLKVWPVGKFPVLRDEARDRLIPESTIIIEYLAQHHPGKTELLPKDPERARETRMRDRFYDHYVHLPMQKIVGDRIRPAGKGDPHGVDEAKGMIANSYAMIDREMASKTWAMGDAFTMADCAAAPALHYANKVVAIGDLHPHVRAYLRRLEERPSFARVLREATPYAAMFPA